MAPPFLHLQRRADAHRLQARLSELDRELARLTRERQEAQQQLEQLRLELAACPRCGRERDFLTDEGGVLIHVLEDPEDVELLSPGKPLFCPDCGEVFLYRLSAAIAPQPKPAPRRRRQNSPSISGRS